MASTTTSNCRIAARVTIVFALLFATSFVSTGQVAFCQATQLQVGFDVADADSDSLVTRAEFEPYVKARIPGEEIDFDFVFKELDRNEDGSLSETEFSKRNEVISQHLGYGGEDFATPADPGKDYVPFSGVDQPTDDAKTIGAVFNRYLDLLQEEDWPKKVRLRKLPRQCSLPFPSAAKAVDSIEGLHLATVVIAGGGEDEFFTGGAVLVSPDGLALTNYHIAEFFNLRMMAMTADGKARRVVELIAGDRAADVALIRLEGENFPFVKLAKAQPASGDDLHMVHHTDMRFYTYDRGYVKRYPKVQDQPWMEVELPYAPGGSGCGIFNRNFELVGLVSLITMGDGPSIASDDLLSDEEYEEGSGSGDEFMMGPPMLIRLAVPWNALDKTWNSKVKTTGSK